MAVTPNSAVTPQGPYFGTASLAAVSACTTRAPTAVASAPGANMIQVVSQNPSTLTNGARIDRVSVKACSTSVSAASAVQCVTVWVSDGVTLYPVPTEIVTTVVTPSTTVASGEWYANFDDLYVPAGGSLWVSTTIATTAATTALAVTVNGAYF